MSSMSINASNTTSLPFVIQGIGIGLATLVLNQIPWSSFFLFTQFLGIRLYKLGRKELCEEIQKKLGGWCSHMTEEGKGFGYSIGFWYVLHLSMESYSSDRGENSYSVWIIATPYSFERLTKATEKVISFTPLLEKQPPPCSIQFLQRYGSYSNPYFIKRQINISIDPWEGQAKIISSMYDHYMKHKHCVVYIHGPPGSGKSMIPILFASRVKGSYCNTLKPWQPGDSLYGLYGDADPDEKSPLILSLDEVDAPLEKIHAGITPHKSMPIMIGDKAGWNHMLDEIQRGLYPHLVLVLTSNKKPEFIDSLDTSYLRKGRVDLTFELLTPTPASSPPSSPPPRRRARGSGK